MACGERTASKTPADGEPGASEGPAEGERKSSLEPEDRRGSEAVADGGEFCGDAREDGALSGDGAKENQGGEERAFEDVGSATKLQSFPKPLFGSFHIVFPSDEAECVVSMDARWGG